MLTSKENNKVQDNLNNKLLEILNDRGTLASYLMSPLSETTNPENTSQFKLVKDPNSNRVNDLLTKQYQLLYITICWHFVIQIKSSNYKEIS